MGLFFSILNSQSVRSAKCIVLFLICFGAFIHRPSLLYTYTWSTQFNFEHVISLTNSSDLLNSSVQEIITSSNINNHEDQQSAMLQGVACNNLIGIWNSFNIQSIVVLCLDCTCYVHKHFRCFSSDNYFINIIEK